MRLSKTFFLRPTLTVAKELLGKHLIYNSPKGELVGEINEVESYIGESDPACHAAGGKTRHNGVMYATGGHAYVYFTYGMHFCLNVVTEQANFPAAILIRSVIPIVGLEIMQQNRFAKVLFQKSVRELTNGPAKLCQAFGLTKEHNAIDLITSDILYLEDAGKKISRFLKTKRIGINRGQEKLWRFYYSS